MAKEYIAVETPTGCRLETSDDHEWIWISDTILTAGSMEELRLKAAIDGYEIDSRPFLATTCPMCRKYRTRIAG